MVCRSTGRRLIIKEEMMKTTIVGVICFGLALSGITAQETETEMEVGAEAVGTYTLASAGTRDTGVAIINKVRLDDEDFDLTGVYVLMLSGESMPPRRLPTLGYKPETPDAWWMYPPPLFSSKTVGESVPIEAGRYAAGVLGVVGYKQFASGRLEFDLSKEAAETYLEPVDHESISVSEGSESTAVSWAAADGAETNLVSAVTADDRLHMAATADTSHSFDPIDGEIELIEIRAFSAPPAHTDETRAEYAIVEGQDLIGFTGGYLSAPIDPAAEEIVHQSIQIVEWVDGEAASVEAETGVERAEPATERAEPEAEVERAEPKAEVERPGEE
jgi:hypothetical protein